MYYFSATSTDTQQLAVVTVIRTTGLEIYPSIGHNIGLLLGSAPQHGGGLMQAVASLVGFNRGRITQMVYENAFGPMAANVVQEAAEMSQEKTSAEAASGNVGLHQYLIGYNRLRFRNFLIEGLTLRSRPENALIGGLLQYLGANGQAGADAPQPSTLAVPRLRRLGRPAPDLAPEQRGPRLPPERRGEGSEPAGGRHRQGRARATPGAGLKTIPNANYPAYLKEVETARAANDPKVLAIRVKRPEKMPDFAADAQGNLVAIVRDFEIEVPAPPQAAQGGFAGPPAKVYRVVSPAAEFGVQFSIAPSAPGGPLQLKGKVVSFDLGPGAKLLAIGDDESKAQALPTLTSALALGVIRSRIQGQALDLPLSNLQLPGFAVRSVSPLDPTGWIRVNLDRTATAVSLATP
ncbi:MAG: hypothetical protein U0835_16150 [Isosphaeraceae bacterium]